jgi:transcriptional regulator GlxA family with amidase domain
MPRNVAFVLFEGAEELDFVGPWEVFTMAAQVQPGEIHCFTVAEVAGPVVCAKGMQVIAEHSFATCPRADIVVLPGGMGTRREMKSPTMLDFLRRLDRDAEFMASVCTGSLVFQKAGLLEGLAATTHWASLGALREAGATDIRSGQRWVDNGRVLTASGVSAGIDMALHLVGRVWGPKVAHLAQKYMEYYPEPPAWPRPGA